MLQLPTKLYLKLPPVLGPELVGNPGFETAGGGGADIWANWIEDLQGGDTLSDEGVIVHGGSHAMKLVTSGVFHSPNTTVYQDMAVTAEKDYRLSFWSRGDGVNNGIVIVYQYTAGMVYLGGGVYPGTVATTYTQSEADVPAFATAAWMRIILYAHSTPAMTVYFDDISLKLMPATDWLENEDVLQTPPLVWEYGIQGHGPTDLLASTGFLNAYLDNSHSNGAGLPGLYSPDNANLLDGFQEGMEVKVTTPNLADWLQLFDDDITVFDAVSPVWDKQVGKLSDFDAVIDPDLHMNDSPDAAHDGPVGLEVQFLDATGAFGWINADAINRTSGCVSFCIDRKDVAIENNKVALVGGLFDGAGTTNWYIYLYNQGGTLKFLLAYRDDGNVWINAGYSGEIPSGYNEVLLMCKRSSAGGADDGFMRLYINASLAVNDTGHDNDTKDWDNGRFGMVNTTSTTFGGSYYMDTIKMDPLGAPFESKLAAYFGDYGLAIPIMDTTNRYVMFTDPNAETICVIDTKFDPRFLSMGNNTEFGMASGGVTRFFATLRYSGGSFLVRGTAVLDAGSISTSNYEITSEYHRLRLEWGAATAPGENDGFLRIYLDYVLLEELTGLDNDTKSVDDIYLGATSGVDADTFGILLMDLCGWSNQLEQDKFIGQISAIRPRAGLFNEPRVEIEAIDWMGYPSTQELGVIPIATDQRADQAITTALANFPVQPEATDFDTGIETFVLMFHTDNQETSMASFLSKMCRNELGRLYTKGDGTLCFENRHARPLTPDPAFVLDGEMTELHISYERSDIMNIIQTRIRLCEIDAAANTEIWDLHDQGCPAIGPGETFEMRCGYTDPDTGESISALTISVFGIEFGGAPDYTSNDMIGWLTQDNTYGANATIMRMTNTHPWKTGYLNDLKLHGKGIYLYDPLTFESRNEESVSGEGLFPGRGERRFMLRLEHINDPNLAASYADFIRGTVSDPNKRARRIGWLANQDLDILCGSVGIEPSTRFTAIESVTGLDEDFFVNRVRYTARGPYLYVDVLAIPEIREGSWIWDESHWDDPDDGRWVL